MLHEIIGRLEVAVLVLDDDRAVVPDAIERPEHQGPIHVTEAGEPGYLPADSRRDAPVLVETLVVDHHIFGLEW